MIVICPSCRAPTNTSETSCWVCRRIFDGSEPVIGDVPGARQPLQLMDVQEYGYFRDRAEPRWRRAG